MKKIYIFAIAILCFNKFVFGMEDERPAKKQKIEQEQQEITVTAKPARSSEEQIFLNKLGYWSKNPRKFAESRLVARQILSEPIAPFFQNLREKFYPINLPIASVVQDLGIELGVIIGQIRMDSSEKYIVCSKFDSNKLFVIDLNTKSIKEIELSNNISVFKLSKDGTLLICGDAKGYVSVYNMENKNEPKLIVESRIFPRRLPSDPYSPVLDLDISPDNNYILAGSLSGKIFLIDFTNKNLSNLIIKNTLTDVETGDTTSLRFDSNGDYALSDGKNGKTNIWDLRNKTNFLMNPLFSIRSFSKSGSSFSNDDNQIIKTSANIIKIYNISDKTRQPELKTQLIGKNATINNSFFTLLNKYIFALESVLIKNKIYLSLSYYDIRNLSDSPESLRLIDVEKDIKTLSIGDGNKLIVAQGNTGRLGQINILPFIDLEKKIYDLTESLGKFKIYLLIEEIIKFRQSFTTSKRPFVIKHPDIKDLFNSPNFPITLRQAMLDKKYVELY